MELSETASAKSLERTLGEQKSQGHCLLGLWNVFIDALGHREIVIFKQRAHGFHKDICDEELTIWAEVKLALGIPSNYSYSGVLQNLHFL